MLNPIRVLTCLLISLLLNASYASRDLPLLGEDARLNLQKEDEIGRGLYLKLKERGYVIEHPLLTRYLSDIGESLLSALDIRLRDYTFYLVKDNSVNAFATPGGYIGVNVGLIMMSRTEDEVASVLAHEIAHVELMHGMQMLEKAQEVNMAGMISLLAALLIGGQNSDLASALVFSSAAGSGQTMLNFTRANEYEADRIGFNLLDESNYDPKAMVTFLRLLQAREQAGELAGIEYIRSHPVNTNRIAEIESRLRTAKKKRLRSRRFDQFKAYLAHVSGPSNTLATQSRFYQVLQLIRNGDYETAEKRLGLLIDEDPDSVWYQYALAENRQYQNRLEAAAEIYRSLLLLYPDDFAIGAELVTVLLKLENYDEVLEWLEKLALNHENKALFHRLKVNLYQKTNNPSARQLAEANYHWYSGNYDRAKKQFQTLIDNNQLTAAEETRVKEKMNKIK